MANLFNIKAVYPQVSLLGVECDPKLFEDLVMKGWELIGNRHTRLYRYVADTDENGVLELPCNADSIEVVTVPVLDAQITSPATINPMMENIFSETYAEGFKKNLNPFYTHGKMVRYKEGNGELYFERPLKGVSVVYHGVIVDDEDGLPLINDKEMYALADFVAYATLLRDGYMRKNADSIKLAQGLQQEWLRKCNAARVPHHLSQNDMNDILDVKTRWDRKKFGISFKPMI